MNASLRKKIFVGMSGGVDSSVSALILKNKGYDVVGVHLRCWNIDGCSEDDTEDARRVAEILDIPFYVFDFTDEYQERVVSYMVSEYKKGRTPNPDVMCNNQIKFGLFFDKAMKLGADYIATGHYVKKKNNSLYQAKEKNKDQSYFLWTLDKEKIKKSLFPLGDFKTKAEVRELAREYKLLTATKKDSQGICFIGKVSLSEFLKKYIKAKDGRIVSEDGKILGSHTGAYQYTVGQRHGLGVGGFPTPLYVLKADVKKNLVVLAPESSKSFLTYGVNLSEVVVDKEVKKKKVLARFRYRQPLVKAELVKSNGSYKVIFKEPQRFVALGQSVVFYEDDGRMLGGGVIEEKF